ncbi:hypothetical protein BDZ97DRAFT_1830909 [Flammula alnicola]|nr:hypothetical protein BDZ97DRAFT_1830909 [Flammula alnicola]
MCWQTRAYYRLQNMFSTFHIFRPYTIVTLASACNVSSPVVCAPRIFSTTTLLLFPDSSGPRLNRSSRPFQSSKRCDFGQDIRCSVYRGPINRKRLYKHKVCTCDIGQLERLKAPFWMIPCVQYESCLFQALPQLTLPFCSKIMLSCNCPSQSISITIFLDQLLLQTPDDGNFPTLQPACAKNTQISPEA